MPVSFDCARCGKHFEVPDALAGKRGLCKQCGNVNRIPMPSRYAEPDRAALDPYGLREAPPAPRREPYRPEPAGAHGFALGDDLVLPRRDRPPVEEDPPEPPFRPRSKRKKRVGFFARQSTTERARSRGKPTVAAGILGGAVAIAVVVVRLLVSQGYVGAFGLSPRSEIEVFYSGFVNLLEEQVALLKSIHDVPSGQAAVPKLVVNIRSMTTLLRANKDKKAVQTAIDEVNARYERRIEVVLEEMDQNYARITQIPGIADVFRELVAPAQELSEVAASASAGGVGAPRRFMRPGAVPGPMLPPGLPGNFGPMQRAHGPGPQPGPGSGPGHGPIGPRFGPRMPGPPPF